MSIEIFTTPPTPEGGPIIVPDPIEPLDPLVVLSPTSTSPAVPPISEPKSGGVYGYEVDGAAAGIA